MKLVLGVGLEPTVSVRCRITNPVQSPLCDPSITLFSTTFVKVSFSINERNR